MRLASFVVYNFAYSMKLMGVGHEEAEEKKDEKKKIKVKEQENIKIEEEKNSELEAGERGDTGAKLPLIPLRHSM